MNDPVIRACAEKYDSFYLYDEQTISRQASRLQNDLPGVQFLYSMKANPHPAVLRTLFAQGFGADAASLNEVLLARDAGLRKEQIYYSAPAKTTNDLRRALPHAILIADSMGELERLQEIAREENRIFSIGVRINPNFSFDGGPGLPTKFGIDEEALFFYLERGRSFPNLKIDGLHVHLHSQELDAAVLTRYYKNLLLLCDRFAVAVKRPIAFLNMGSGIGIPYAPEEQEVDTAQLGQSLAALLPDFRKRFPTTKILIETGRYVVGDAGIYVTKVIDRKTSRGKTYLLLKNTLNGFLRPALSFAVEKAARGAIDMAEPFYTGKNTFQLYTFKNEPDTEHVTLVGNLCAATDQIAEDILLPRLVPGDLIAVNHAGAYAAVLSPMQFSSQEKPVELFLKRDGTILEPAQMQGLS